jgi:hypothetical protein
VGGLDPLCKAEKHGPLNDFHRKASNLPEARAN